MQAEMWRHGARHQYQKTEFGTGIGRAALRVRPPTMEGFPLLAAGNSTSSPDSRAKLPSYSLACDATSSPVGRGHNRLDRLNDDLVVVCEVVCFR